MNLVSILIVVILTTVAIVCAIYGFLSLLPSNHYTHKDGFTTKLEQCFWCGIVLFFMSFLSILTVRWVMA